MLNRSVDLTEVDSLITDASQSSAEHLIRSCGEWTALKDVQMRSQSAREQSRSVIECFHAAKSKAEFQVPTTDIFSDAIVSGIQSWRNHVLPTKAKINEALQLYYAERKSNLSRDRKVFFLKQDIMHIESALLEITAIEQVEYLAHCLG